MSIALEDASRVLEALAERHSSTADRRQHMAEVLHEVALAFWGPVLEATPGDFDGADSVYDRIQLVTERAASELEVIFRIVETDAPSATTKTVSPDKEGGTRAA